MTWPSPLTLVTESKLNVRRIAGRDAARPSYRFVSVRRDRLVLTSADSPATHPSARHSSVLIMMAFRPQPRQTASVVAIVAVQSP